jgi:hypothetical protein
VWILGFGECFIDGSMFLRLRCHLVIIWHDDWHDDASEHVDCSEYGTSYDYGPWRDGNDRRNGLK